MELVGVKIENGIWKAEVMGIRTEQALKRESSEVLVLVRENVNETEVLGLKFLLCLILWSPVGVFIAKSKGFSTSLSSKSSHLTSVQFIENQSLFSALISATKDHKGHFHKRRKGKHRKERNHGKTSNWGKMGSQIC